MTDNDKSPRFDDPKNITVGRARVIYVRATLALNRAATRSRLRATCYAGDGEGKRYEL